MTATEPKVWLGEDRIMRVDLGEGVTVTAEISKHAQEKRLQLSFDRHPLLLYAGGLTGYDNEAAAFLLSGDVVARTAALAIVAGSSLSEMLGQMFMSYYRPPMPSQLFTDEQQAIAWLQQYRDT